MPDGEGLFTFQPRPKCICGAPLAADSRERVARSPWGDVHFRRCPSCGSWCQSPQIRADSLGAWYDSDAYQGSARRAGAAYENYEADEPARLAEARQRYARDIRPCLAREPSRILEIGCASASLLAVARTAGHTVTGVDLSGRFAEQARRLNGVEVIVGDFLKVPLAEGAFDAVLLFGTLSNLPDLDEALRKIRRLLRRDGWVILNYPDSGSLLAAAYGRRFWMFTPSVVAFASARGLATCAAASGLSVQRMRIDWQRPSFGKLLRHTGLANLLPRWAHGALASRPLPFSIPIPGVRIAWLRPG